MGTPVEYANICYAGNTLSILSACFPMWPQGESDEYRPHIPPVIHYNLIIRREYVNNLTKPEEYAAGIHLIPLVETRRQNRQRIPCVTNVCVFHRCSHACILSILRVSQNSGNTQEVLSQSRCLILEQNTLPGKQAAIRVFPTGICSPSRCATS